MTEEVTQNEISESEVTELECVPKMTCQAPEDPEQISGLLEALLFACGEPLSSARLAEVTGLEVTKIEEAIALLQGRLMEESSGIELVIVAEKYQLRTKIRYAPFVRELKSGRPRALSIAALETLSVIAYRQPVVKSDIEKIRGVDATPTIKTLLDRKLIKIVGHQQSVGQPALYGTTEEFLKIFGLGSLAELPTLRDLKEIDSDPGETEERSTADGLQTLPSDPIMEESQAIQEVIN